MSIRNAAKAVILKEGRILLQRCRNASGMVYYDLPGGGQNQYETMEEAVVRECLEETGFTVSVERFLAVGEEIVVNDEWREQYGVDYTHRIFHIFLCRVEEIPAIQPSEADFEQECMEWVPLERIEEITLFPAAFKPCLRRLGDGENLYFGSERVRR